MNKEINKLIKQIPIIKKKKINQLYMGRTWDSFIYAVNDTQAAKHDLFSCRKIGNVYYIYYGAPKRTMSQTYAKEIYKVMGWYNVMVKPGWTSWKQTTNRFKQKQCWLAVEDGTITKESKLQKKLLKNKIVQTKYSDVTKLSKQVIKRLLAYYEVPQLKLNPNLIMDVERGIRAMIYDPQRSRSPYSNGFSEYDIMCWIKQLPRMGKSYNLQGIYQLEDGIDKIIDKIKIYLKQNKQILKSLVKQLKSYHYMH